MIQSLTRGIKILEIFEKSRSAGVTEVAAKLGINKSSAFRLLDTLRENNLVEQDPITEKYHLGAGILKFSNSYLNSFDIIKRSRPHLEKLSASTNESAHLCIFSNDRVIVIDQVKSDEVIKVTASIGREEVIYCTSVGKAVLAFLPDHVRAKILNSTELSPLTPYTITSRDELEKELEEIRKRGYAVDNEEMTLGVRCIGAPIMNHEDEVVYCVGLSASAMRIQVRSIPAYAEPVKKAARDISITLGCERY